MILIARVTIKEVQDLQDVLFQCLVEENRKGCKD